MHTLLIQTSPREQDSISRRLADYLTEQLSCSTLTLRDLAEDSLPTPVRQDLLALHSGSGDGSPALAGLRQLEDRLIGELMVADTLVMGIAMHNFSVPVVLKQWVDYVCRAGKTFRYSEDGPRGLTGISDAFLVTATGGAPVGGTMDFATGYMAHIAHFLGVRQVHVIDAGGSKGTPEATLARGRLQIDRLLDNHLTLAV
ncbi:MAG: ACP phosphodiesterase [Porticoccaceae bacterium]|nr:ACP phosphodiesterase [Porticoccaceae bacterium]